MYQCTIPMYSTVTCTIKRSSNVAGKKPSTMLQQQQQQRYPPMYQFAQNCTCTAQVYAHVRSPVPAQTMYDVRPECTSKRQQNTISMYSPRQNSPARQRSAAARSAQQSSRTTANVPVAKTLPCTNVPEHHRLYENVEQNIEQQHTIIPATEWQQVKIPCTITSLPERKE